jgi:hypothetical protein
MCTEPNPTGVDPKSRDLPDEWSHTATKATPTGEKGESGQIAFPPQRERNRLVPVE